MEPDFNVLKVLQNKPFLGAIIAQLSAQGVKPFFHLAKYRKLDIMKAFEYGNFPSGHTAFIVGVTAGIGLSHGWDSSLFGLALVVTAIIIYDIVKMRRTVEVTLTAVLELHEKGAVTLPPKTPQFKGHTPGEVLAGAVWGIFWAVIIHFAI